jgi:hypothetical protein
MMRCPSCKKDRPITEALCPHCYASSPLASTALVPVSQNTGEMVQQAFPSIDVNLQRASSMLPALPDTEAPTYIAPMYLKPRPIIPPYRAISGLLSVLIVFGMLCAGAGYYAQVTGKLTPLERFLGITSPAKITVAATTQLTVPSNLPIPGPGVASISQAALASSIDPQTGVIRISTNNFTVMQLIQVECTITTTTPGIIETKWYTGNNFFKEKDQSVTEADIKSGHTTAIIPMQYAFPTEAKVEILWNNVLGQTLMFVVQPK